MTNQPRPSWRDHWDPTWLDDSALWRLVRPPREQDFLVDDEVIWWENRYHSAILLQPAFELIAALTLMTWLQLDIGLTRSAIAVVFVLASVFILGRLILRVHRSTRRSAAIAAGFVLIAYALRNDQELLANLVVIGFALRFAFRFLRWRWYRRLIVTDRRVIEVDGLIGSSVATMPLFRITDALIQVSPVAEILGYALFRIESAGQDQALGRINFLDDAERFHRLVIELSTAPKAMVPVSAQPHRRAAAHARLAEPSAVPTNQAAEIDRLL